MRDWLCELGYNEDFANDRSMLSDEARENFSKHFYVDNVDKNSLAAAIRKLNDKPAYELIKEDFENVLKHFRLPVKDEIKTQYSGFYKYIFRLEAVFTRISTATITHASKVSSESHNQLPVVEIAKHIAKPAEGALAAGTTSRDDYLSLRRQLLVHGFNSEFAKDINKLGKEAKENFVSLFYKSRGHSGQALLTLDSMPENELTNQGFRNVFQYLHLPVKNEVKTQFPDLYEKYIKPIEAVWACFEEPKVGYSPKLFGASSDKAPQIDVPKANIPESAPRAIPRRWGF